jgi:hypothetical protein
MKTWSNSRPRWAGSSMDTDDDYYCDPDVDRAWAEECERRLDGYLRDETTALNVEDVLAKHLKP